MTRRLPQWSIQSWTWTGTVCAMTSTDFFSAMTTEEFNKMMKNQENNVVKTPGNLREPNFKQHLLSQLTQDALFTIAYHLMKLYIETKGQGDCVHLQLFAGDQCAPP